MSAALLGVGLAFAVGSTSLVLLAAFLYLGGFQFFPLGLSPAAALAWDALLSGAFFVQHSVMVRRSFRQRLGIWVPEAFHGVVYTIASGSVLTFCLVLWQRVGEPIVQLEGAGGWFLRAGFILAIGGFVWGFRSLESFDTLGVGPVIALWRGVRPPSDVFVVKGPYRWVRHPLYLFGLVLFWSCPVITPDRLLFDVLWSLWVALATMLEERDLVLRFGESYVQYQREVPMIVPWRICNRRARVESMR